MAVPTQETTRILFWSSVGSTMYYALLAGCLLYLLWWMFVEIRDCIRAVKIKRYLKENCPVECILDYPMYAMDEFSRDNED